MIKTFKKIPYSTVHLPVRQLADSSEDEAGTHSRSQSRGLGFSFLFYRL